MSEIKQANVSPPEGASCIVIINKLFGHSKQQLLLRMASSDNTIALDAVKKLQAQNCFKDGTLRGLRLSGANLFKGRLAQADMQGALLENANLAESYLGKTNLTGANLRAANLQGANMREVILTGADLTGANLHSAHLASARLRGINLSEANVQAANFWGANLQDAQLAGAVFDEHTVLPDGTRWNTETDTARFTDAAHPQFWRSDNPHSPAHH